MMKHAIELEEGKFGVIPVFRIEEVTRLTPNGFQNVIRTECILYEAKGLGIVGRGDSLKSPEDVGDDSIGLRKALGRALKDAEAILPEERDIVFKHLIREIRLAIVQREQERAGQAMMIAEPYEVPPDVFETMREIDREIEEIPF